MEPRPSAGRETYSARLPDRSPRRNSRRQARGGAMPVRRPIADRGLDPRARWFPRRRQPHRRAQRVDGVRPGGGRSGVKKVLVGCLIVLVIAMIGFGVAGYYAYRWAQPMIQSTGDYLERAREMTRLGERVQNRSSYTPPANGELTTAQVDRFLAVQTRVRDELAT